MEQRFATEDACREYLTRLRWPTGFICPACQGKIGWVDRRHRWTCQDCRGQFTVTAGTIFDGTHLPLQVWFRAVWLVTSQKSGASALGVQRVLGLGSYRTAWSWLHKLRRAMVRPGRERLKGKVEVDEAFVGGVSSGTGRDGLGKAMVAIAAEEDGKGIGRIRLARVADASTPSLHGFIQQAIAPGSTVHTDGWAPYQGLEKLGYSHGGVKKLISAVRRRRRPSNFLGNRGCVFDSFRRLPIFSQLPRHYQAQRPREGGRRGVAPTCASCCLAAQALAAGHSPRRGWTNALGLLSRRIHFPI